MTKTNSSGYSNYKCNIKILERREKKRKKENELDKLKEKWKSGRARLTICTSCPILHPVTFAHAL